MAPAGAPSALAATKQLPIRSGPHGLSRAPGVDALERPGTLATVTGWGQHHPAAGRSRRRRDQLPDRMREAQVPIVSRPECQTVYSNVGAPIDATRSRGAYR
jgi:hypothetical protein